jgi:hypothetical protein
MKSRIKDRSWGTQLSGELQIAPQWSIQSHYAYQRHTPESGDDPTFRRLRTTRWTPGSHGMPHRNGALDLEGSMWLDVNVQPTIQGPTRKTVPLLDSPLSGEISSTESTCGCRQPFQHRIELPG